jgi:hypothetical protein
MDPDGPKHPDPMDPDPQHWKIFLTNTRYVEFSRTFRLDKYIF